MMRRVTLTLKGVWCRLNVATVTILAASLGAPIWIWFFIQLAQ